MPWKLLHRVARIAMGIARRATETYEHLAIEWQKTTGEHPCHGEFLETCVGLPVFARHEDSYAARMRALVFDLDGTLIDTVYPHTLAWQHAFSSMRIHVDASRIHPRIGLPGTLLVAAIGRDIGRTFKPHEHKKLDQVHLQFFKKLTTHRAPLKGAIELLAYLRDHDILHGLATAGGAEEIAPSLKALKIPKSTVVIGKQDAPEAKPEPDPILECLERLHVSTNEAYFVGDSIWDCLAARRCRVQSLAVSTGGRDSADLFHAGAARVFENPAELLASIEELGFD